MNIIVNDHATERVIKRLNNKASTSLEAEIYLINKLKKYLKNEGEKYEKGDAKCGSFYVKSRYHKLIYREWANGTLEIVTYWNKGTIKGYQASRDFQRIENIF